MDENAKQTTERAWERFCDRLRDSGRRLIHEGKGESAQELAEGARWLTRLVSCGLQQVVEFSDVDRPIFFDNPAAHMKWGGENADNLYQHAAIDGAGTYRVSGQRGTVSDFIVQTSACGPMEAAGTGARRGKDTRIAGELAAHDLEVAPDGSFEITVSPKPHPGNWIESHADVGFVLVRQYFRDWEHEQPASFRIERIDREWDVSPALSPVQVATWLDDAGAWIGHSVDIWNGWVRDEFERHPDNQLAPLGTGGDVEEGVAAIHYGQGTFDLAPDQALVLECEVPQAPYWQVDLLSVWFETLDYMHRQTSLNDHQTHVDPDGRFRMVICARDPGVPNWLDTAGHRRGMLQYRWVFSRTMPRPAPRVVRLDELTTALHPDTPRVTPEQRRQALRVRRAHVIRRHRWE
jgi:hypothetical protein